MKHLLLTSLLLACSIPGMVSAAGENYPNRSITIVIPTAPGGGNDGMARILAEKMGSDLGQSVIVENKPGANGSIASTYVARAKPDGYTILFGYIATHAINPAIKKLPYDPVNDFEPIGKVATSPTLMVINNKIPAKTVAEFITLAKKDGANFNYASAGSGTAPSAAGALFQMATGTKMQNISYKGSNPGMMDTIGGTTQLMFPSLFSAAPHIKNGSVRAMAVAGEKRSKVFPELPTLKELGIDVSVDQWYALFAPAGTPAAIVDKLNATLNAALESKEVSEKFDAHGANIETSTPAELKQLVIDDLAKWKKVGASAGAQMH